MPQLPPDKTLQRNALSKNSRISWYTGRTRHSISQHGRQWPTKVMDDKVLVNSQKAIFEVDTGPKVDTGPEVMVVSEEFYHTLKGVNLRMTQKKNFLALDATCWCHRRVWSYTVTQESQSEQRVIVVWGLCMNVRGLLAIIVLNPVSRVESSNEREYGQLTEESFPSLSQGLGNLGELYRFQLKPDAKPSTLYTPRNVPLPLRENVGEELSRIESLGVISKVDQPTPWCARMVAVP